MIKNLVISIFTFLISFIFCFLFIPSCADKDLSSISDSSAVDADEEALRLAELQKNWDLVEDGIHIRTGLKNDEHLQLIIGACTSCHSAQLITQNRATRDGWKQMLEWMYATQGLPYLGVHEPKVLDYLAKHYAPERVGRRKNLNVANIEWYLLDNVD